MIYRVRLLRDVPDVGDEGLVADVGRQVKGKLIDSGAGEVEAFVPESRMVKPTVIDVRVSGEPDEE